METKSADDTWLIKVRPHFFQVVIGFYLISERKRDNVALHSTTYSAEVFTDSVIYSDR